MRKHSVALVLMILCVAVVVSGCYSLTRVESNKKEISSGIFGVPLMHKTIEGQIAPLPGPSAKGMCPSCPCRQQCMKRMAKAPEKPASPHTGAAEAKCPMQGK